MAIFFTSDTHFGHANIIGYCRRPFDSVQEMDDAMVATWNSIVRPGDDVWHLGDFAHGADAKHVRAVFHRLNGRKRLVIGNHDRQETLDLPWAAPPTHLATVGVDGVRVVMCRYGLRVWPGMRRSHSALVVESAQGASRPGREPLKPRSPDEADRVARLQRGSHARRAATRARARNGGHVPASSPRRSPNARHTDPRQR